MDELKGVKAIVGKDCVPDLIQALKGAGITRFFVSRIDALSAQMSDVVNVRTGDRDHIALI